MYGRFLNNKDYLAIITDTALSQLIRNNENRFVQAEQAAEASVIDYLSENYEVEQALHIGKRIREYDRRITYPVGSHFYFQGEICEVIQAINGYKSPSVISYWKPYTEMVEVSELPKYSQMLNYYPCDVVQFLNKAYECVFENGFDFNDIRIPGISAWKQVKTEVWQSVDYNLWDVVEYNGSFYALIDTAGFDPLVDPNTSTCWGLIGNYDSSLDTYELSVHEYVVYQNMVFYPVLNPNAVLPEIGKNIRHHDPRNYNLKKHMTQLALYELHKLISPTNISTVRIDDYEHTMLWLKDASRLKLNPQIPRKRGEDKKVITDWQMATFQADYDPYKNPWHI